MVPIDSAELPSAPAESDLLSSNETLPATGVSRVTNVSHSTARFAAIRTDWDTGSAAGPMHSLVRKNVLFATSTELHRPTMFNAVRT